MTPPCTLPPSSSPTAQATERGATAGWLHDARHGLLMGAAALALVLPPAGVALMGTQAGFGMKMDTSLRQQSVRLADFAGESASDDARLIAHWVADSGDNQGLSFVIIDKKNAKVFVFDPQAKLNGATPVLIGAARGDDSVTGIGKRPIHEVRPEERTTAAGRFMAEPGRNALGEDVVWVDYEAAVSMHRVRVTDPAERRLERLATPETDDNRISYGCINIPVAFYENTMKPAFNARYGVAYVLPETKPLGAVFANAYDPRKRATRPAKTL